MKKLSLLVLFSLVVTSCFRNSGVGAPSQNNGQKVRPPFPVKRNETVETWRRDGWLKRPARNLACLGLYAIGFAPERIARFYA